MAWFERLKKYINNHMASNSEMFDVYVKYFAAQNKKIKLQRRGVSILGSSGEVIEHYSSWIDLDKVYKQVNKYENEELPVITERIYCWGNLNINIASKLRNKITGQANAYAPFDKPNYIYFLDSKGNLCQTCNDMVIDLITNSKDWKEYKYEPIKITKAEIAKRFGYSSPDEFEII